MAQMKSTWCNLPIHIRNLYMDKFDEHISKGEIISAQLLSVRARIAGGKKLSINTDKQKRMKTASLSGQVIKEVPFSAVVKAEMGEHFQCVGNETRREYEHIVDGGSDVDLTLLYNSPCISPFLTRKCNLTDVSQSLERVIPAWMERDLREMLRRTLKGFNAYPCLSGETHEWLRKTGVFVSVIQFCVQATNVINSLALNGRANYEAFSDWLEYVIAVAHNKPHVKRCPGKFFVTPPGMKISHFECINFYGLMNTNCLNPTLLENDNELIHRLVTGGQSVITYDKNWRKWKRPKTVIILPPDTQKLKEGLMDAGIFSEKYRTVSRQRREERNEFYRAHPQAANFPSRKISSSSIRTTSSLTEVSKMEVMENLRRKGIRIRFEMEEYIKAFVNLVENYHTVIIRATTFEEGFKDYLNTLY